MKKIAIIGAGGFGREVLGIIRDIGSLRPVGFLDNNSHLIGKTIDGCTVLGNDYMLRDLVSQGIDSVFIALSDGRIRKRLYSMCTEIGLYLPNLVHPMAYVSSETHIGHGNVFYPGCVVMPGCQIGNCVLVNAGATIGHDSKIGDFCNINPGANVAGRVTLQEGVFVGIGACLRENVTVSEYAIIGAGSVVVTDVPGNTTFYGVPARERSKLTV